MSSTQRPFTLDIVKWRPWLDTIDEIGATPEQTALVDAIAPNPVGRSYYTLLAHDAPVLRERTALMKAAMYGREGATRAERELAAVATSRANGCVHCASIHARLYNQLTKTTDVIQHLLDDGVDTPLAPHERALVDYAVKLSHDPASITVADLKPLRDAGYSDLAILDLTHVIGMFNWANELYLPLGEIEGTEPATL